MSRLTRATQIGTALIRTSLLTAMQYRSDLAFDAFAGLLRTIATSAPLLLVFQRDQTIAGWTLPEAAWVMSLYLLMQGILGGLVEPNLGEVVESVRSGNFDLVLMKPADAQLLVSVRTVAPSHIWDVLASILLASWAVSMLARKKVCMCTHALVHTSAPAWMVIIRSTSVSSSMR